LAEILPGIHANTQKIYAITPISTGVRKALYGALALTVAAISLPKDAIAATTTWNGSQSTNNWGIAGNWSDSYQPGTGPGTGFPGVIVVPTATDTAIIDIVGIAAPVVNSNQSIGQLLVGNSVSGSLMITGGGVLTGGSNGTNAFTGSIGNNAGSNGAVTVSGAGSQLNYAAALNVGAAGTGTLSIFDGGAVSTGNEFDIGSGVGSVGTVVVSGTNSTLTTTNATTGFYVGKQGTGFLTIEQGGVATTAGNTSIGSQIGQGNGTVLVTGAGSAWNNASNLTVGDGATGVLTIADGAIVTNSIGSVGNLATAVGTVNVTGANSTWTNTGALTIGSAGTGVLTIANGGVVNNTNGFVGQIANSNGTVLVSGVNTLWANSGVLDVAESGTGVITVVDNGQVTASSIVLATQAGSIGTINIGDGGQAGILVADSITGGAGTGTLNLNYTNAINFTALLSGNLTVNQVNSGTTRLLAASDYSGTTTVSAGIWQAGTTNAFSATSDYIVGTQAQLDLASFNQTIGSLDNSGVVNFSSPPGTALTMAGRSIRSNSSSTPGTVLTVVGNYIGNNGLINFNTVLNGDNSATDKLVVDGNTSGTTVINVTNIGGSGAATLNGIELVQVNGTSNGEFVKPNRLIAGAYDYLLGRGTGANISNWYLTSVLRPETAGYSTNLAAANTMFVTRLHDRLGETQYIDALTGEQKVTSMWLRNEGSHNRSRDTTGQLATRDNRYVIQLGGDIAQWSNNDLDRLHLGVMAGYAHSKSRTDSRVSPYSSRASVDGYSTGVYGTWYANEADKSGLYIDSWAQYSWFNNTIEGQEVSTEEYKSKGFTASIESGFTFKMDENAKYFIQPKAQLTWMGVKADDHKEANDIDINVSGEGNGNIQTRLGVKAFMNGSSDQDKGDYLVFQPFVEANWIHNTKNFGATLNNVTVEQDGAANIAELKLGVEGKINKKVNVWGNLGQQVGNKGYNESAVTLGVKYHF
jgi:autotransporter family porin